jgi:integral membrane protein (TIGR01906 family)
MQSAVTPAAGAHSMEPVPGALARLGRIAAALAAATFIVCLPVVLITSNVRVLVSDVGYYRHGLRAYGAEAATGVPLSELDRAAQEIVDYFENDASTLRIVVSVSGQEEPLFNTRETQHMADVKKVMRFVFRLNEFSLVYVLAYVTCVFLWSRERGLRSLAVQSLIGLGVGFAFVGVIGAFALTGFDQAWTEFHKLVFHNDLWLLDPATDHLIQMFPEPFWKEATYLVGGLALAETVLVVVLATGYLLFSRGSRTGAPAS